MRTYFNFDTYVRLKNKVLLVKVGMSVDSSKCTCRFYLKNYVCVHILAFLKELGVYQCCNILGLFEFDRNATAVPLGQKRGPGRPRNNGPALTRDD